MVVLPRLGYILIEEYKNYLKLKGEAEHILLKESADLDFVAIHHLKQRTRTLADSMHSVSKKFAKVTHHQIDKFLGENQDVKRTGT